ncbi:MAG: glycosyltransferase family 2 protein [Thermotogota bacterium]
MKQVNYSVIIPVYNSEDIVRETVERTIHFFKSYNFSFEIILVNDGSHDGSWELIKKLAQNNNNVVSIDLLKNYGQHSAILCGIHCSNGDYLITLDDDLQNPPEEIIKLINKIHEGHDLVFAKFREKRHNSIRKKGSKLINYFNTKIFNKPKGLVLTNFRIFSRDVAERMIRYKTFYPYIPGLLIMFSYSMANVETEHHERKAGKSNYSFFKILKLIARLLFNYSSFPLKVMTYIGVSVSMASFLIGIYFILKKIIDGVAVEGWTTIIVLLAFFNGFLIIMVGIMGEYLARVLNQVTSTRAYETKEIIDHEE